MSTLSFQEQRLLLAFHQGDWKQVEDEFVYIKDPASIRFPNGNTFLHLCARYGAPRHVFDICLPLCCSVMDETNVYGKSALQLAPSIHIFATLLQAGANPNTRMPHGESLIHTYTQLYLNHPTDPVLFDYQRILLLLKYGANPNQGARTALQRLYSTTVSPLTKVFILQVMCCVHRIKRLGVYSLLPRVPMDLLRRLYEYF
jgi:hypothetical protein